MASIAIYSISVALVFAICSIVYKVCLANTTLHRLNRAVILSVYAISLTAPLLVPTLGRFSSSVHSVDTPAAAIAFGEPIVDFVTVEETSGLWSYVPIVYSIGALAALAFTLIGIFLIAKIIRKGEKRKIEDATLVVVDSDVSPFSWWRYIVVSKSDADNSIILRHELLHVHSRHTIDMMFAQAFAIFNWFNPFAWIMRKELSAQHEYAVDAAVLEEGVAPRDYQMLIVRKAVGLNMGPLANCLHSSQLKKRVKMMIKSKSKTVRGLLAAAIVPAAIAAMAILNTPAVASSLEKMSPVEHSEKNDTIVSAIDEIKVVGYGTVKKEDRPIQLNAAMLYDVKITIDGKAASEEQLNALNPNDIADITVFRDPDRIIINTKASQARSEVKPEDEVQLPQFIEGEPEMFRRLASELRYPEDAMKEQIQGKAVVGFMVNPDGKADQFEITKSSGNVSLDAEAVRACAAVLSSDWMPGKKNGEAVAVHYAVPVNFSLQ